MKKEFEKLGLDKDYPSMYYMVEWMTHQHEHSGGFGLSFEGFIEQAAFYFSQRYHDKGLRDIFRLFDLDDSGFLDFD
jgi:Ca2+-binding EF-hand superfamily protein